MCLAPVYRKEWSAMFCTSVHDSIVSCTMLLHSSCLVVLVHASSQEMQHTQDLELHTLSYNTPISFCFWALLIASIWDSILSTLYICWMTSEQQCPCVFALVHYNIINMSGEKLFLITNRILLMSLFVCRKEGSSTNTLQKFVHILWKVQYSFQYFWWIQLIN